MNTVQLKSALASIVACLCGVVLVGSISAQGISLRGIGSVNEGMGGAGTGLPLSAAGAIHWNPASIAEFRKHQIEMGLGLVYADSRVSSTMPFMSGSSRADSGVAPLPVMAMVLKHDNPRLTTGIGVYAIAGFQLNYRASQTNPIHMSQGALGGLPTLGRVHTQAEFFQIAPTVACALNDCWSIGLAPTVTIARLGIEPLFAAANTGSGYPVGSGSRYVFGGGGQIGLYYKPNQRLSAGLTVKSRQFFEDRNTFKFFAQDNAPPFVPVEAETRFEYPTIVSLGMGYRVNACTQLAADIRYFDYGQAEGFGTAGFNPDGSVAGLGWSSVMAVALGASHQVNRKLTLRCGYVWNDSPISNDNLLINSAAPLILKNVATVGLGLRVHPRMTVNTAYLQAFDTAQSGPYLGIPGTDITTRLAAYILSTGVTVDF